MRGLWKSDGKVAVALPRLAAVFSTTLIALLAVSGASGQQKASPAAWADTVASAKKEGKVVIYSIIPADAMARVAADFSKVNPGISVEHVRLSAAPIAAKLDAERQSGADGADLQITSDVGWVEERVKDGTHRVAVGPNAAAWPSAFMIRGVVPVLSLAPLGILYNTNLVKTPISSYEDLLRPELRRGVGMIVLVSPTHLAFYDWLEKTQAPGYFAKLSAQSPRFYDTTPVAAQMVASGELPAASFVDPAAAFPMIKQGAPVKLVFPKQAFGFRYVGQILGWAKRPNAAQVFMDYIMSPRGQTVWTSEGDLASPIKVAGSASAEGITPYDPNAFSADAGKAYRAKWEGIFRK